MQIWHAEIPSVSMSLVMDFLEKPIWAHRKMPNNNRLKDNFWTENRPDKLVDTTAAIDRLRGAIDMCMSEREG
jgi:hypothetical protein